MQSIQIGQHISIETTYMNQKQYIIQQKQRELYMRLDLDVDEGDDGEEEEVPVVERAPPHSRLLFTDEEECEINNFSWKKSTATGVSPPPA